ncbi:hypothetical protein [Streptomyces sp. CCM_MD2014]|uniref:hypothetical protein n=1 Tax=Streptomyces sp. CCM_MD2014 TaxID=1561022 RepID=UPI0007766778|nr:hypothetical protein [Streptomyces sp. CCM_MD2014]
MRPSGCATTLLAAAYLSAGAFLAHAATVTVNNGGSTRYAVTLYASAGLAAAAAVGTVTATRRPPHPRTATAADDRRALAATDPDELHRTAVVICPQDRGEDPFAWSEPDNLPPVPTRTTENPMTTSNQPPCEVPHETPEEEESCERRRLTGAGDQEEPQLRAFHELRESGLLWLINHRLLHRRGLALALHLDADDGTATGWNLLRSPDGQPWTFDTATNEHGRERAEATLTAAGALPTRQVPEFPPFTGDTAECPKCSYDLVRTTYCHALTAMARDTLNELWVWGPLPERHRRECERCEYQWFEATGQDPTLPVPLTERQLAYALDNSTPYPEELHPQVAAAMAASLVKMFTAYARPGHVVWDPEVEEARPEDVRPTPADDAPPAEVSADEAAGA